MSDYYNILGVNKNASQSDIKKAFRKKAKETHPDKNGGDDSKFKQVNEAYEVLSDETKKSNYDNYGDPKGFGGNPFGGGGNPFGGGGDPFGDIFGDMFGQRRQRQQPRQRKGSNLRLTIKVTLLDVLNGLKKTIKIKRKTKCGTCSGAGGTDSRTCMQCNGRGTRTVTQRMGFANFQQTVTCDNCNGEGKVVLNKCNTCHGAGGKDVQETIEINIPKGVFNGVVLTEPGKGNYARNGSYGDLLIQIQEERHPHIIRDGNNLYYNKDISVVDAILGGKIEIQGIERKLSFNLSQGTQNEIGRAHV